MIIRFVLVGFQIQSSVQQWLLPLRITTLRKMCERACSDVTCMSDSRSELKFLPCGIDLKISRFNRETLKSSDCVVIVTDHSNVDYRFLAKNARLIVDTRNTLKDIKDRSLRKKIVKL